MLRELVPGAALAAVAGLVVLIGDWLDWNLTPVALLGVALGGALALVPGTGLALRMAGFAVGLVVAWAMYGVRALLLPDTDGGRAVAAVLVVAVCAVVAALTAGRLPLWSALVGVAAMVGAYEEAYTASPPDVLTTSPSAATPALVAAAAGFVAAALSAAAVESVGSTRRGAHTAEANDEEAMA